MKYTYLTTACLFYLFTLAMVGCEKKTVEDLPNEEEVITTLKLTLISSLPTPDTVNLFFQDLDGDGGNAPTIMVSDALGVGRVYTGEIILLNGGKVPATNVTEEIKEEALEHQFFYMQEGNLFTTIAYTDQDDEQTPIGIKTEFAVSSTPTIGKLTVTLRHQPDKSGIDVAKGDITNAGGETDIEVTFDLTVM